MTPPSQGPHPPLTPEDLADLRAALRIAASSIEMAGLHFAPDAAEPIGRDAIERAAIALRRQSARYRKLAARLSKPG